MKNELLELCIADCFDCINEQDPKAAEYWVKQLFNKQGDIKPHMITEMTLIRLENELSDLYFQALQGV